MSKEFDKHSNCLLCGSSDIRPKKKYTDSYLVACHQCDFIFVERIPSEEELIAHYNNYGRNDFLSPITVKRYHEILDFLEPYRKTNQIIDVGCGIGHFLEVAKERGWEVHGTEYTDDAISICKAKGIKMTQGPLQIDNYSKGQFDVIISIEVIEHINNPNDELKRFNAILRKGGAVYITTPNFNSMSRYYLRNNWSVIEYPEHLSYYTAGTLKQLISHHGFQAKWIKTTGISLTRFTSGFSKSKSSSGNDPIIEQPTELIGNNTKDERLRVSMESNPLMKLGKNAANGLLNIFRKGDNMKGLFEKTQ